MFVFLTAKISAGTVNERTYRGACVIELIHTATLVHDDVVMIVIAVVDFFD
jgi:octaprenyl-diphosphate synthase